MRAGPAPPRGSAFRTAAGRRASAVPTPYRDSGRTPGRRLTPSGSASSHCSSIDATQLLHQPVGEFDAGVKIADLVALVAPMPADIANVIPTAADSVARDSHLLYRRHERRIGRGFTAADNAAKHVHPDSRIGDCGLDRGLRALFGFIRHDAALNSCRGALWQRVFLMASRDQRRYTGRMQNSVEGRIARQAPRRSEIDLWRGYRLHVGARLAVLHQRGPGEIQARGRTGLERKFIVREAHQAVRKLIDRVVGPRLR